MKLKTTKTLYHSSARAPGTVPHGKSSFVVVAFERNIFKIKKLSEKNFFFPSPLFFSLLLLSGQVQSMFKACTIAQSEALLRMVTPGAGFRGVTLYDVTPLMKMMSKSR